MIQFTEKRWSDIRDLIHWHAHSLWPVVRDRDGSVEYEDIFSEGLFVVAQLLKSGRLESIPENKHIQFLGQSARLRMLTFINRRCHEAVSFDLLNHPNQPLPIGETFIDESSLTTEEQIELSCVREAIFHELEGLTRGEREALILRFGLDGGGERDYPGVAREMGFSRQRARMCTLVGLEKLRKSERLRDWLLA